MKNINRILIIRTDRIGDVVLTTPAINAMRLAYPNAFIAVLVSPTTADLIKHHPCINEVLVDDRRGEHKGMTGFIRLVEMIRQHHFDIAINFHTKRRTNLLCYLARIPRRVGYKNNKFGFLLTDQVSDIRHFGEKHEAQFCMEVVTRLDIPAAPLTPVIVLDKEWKQWAVDMLGKYKIKPDQWLIAIHLGASDPAKCWPVKSFAELINSIKEKYPAQIVLVGDASTHDLAKELIFRLEEAVIDLTGKTSIGQLAAVLEGCKLLISNDSGPVHVADAVGTKVVSIFTRNQPGINPKRWRPLNPQSAVVSVEPGQNHNFTKAGTIDDKYLELIEPQQVLDSVDAILNLC